METFENKKVWHSQLRQKNPLVVSFGSARIVESKYSKPGQIDYMIYFDVRGDDNEYYYHIENDEIRRALGDVKSGQLYALTATGMQEDAELKIQEIDGEVTAKEWSPPNEEKDALKEAVKDGPTPPQTTGYTHILSHSEGSVSADMEACLKAAHKLFFNVFPGWDGVNVEVIERLAVSMFIQMNMNNFSVPLNQVEPVTTSTTETPNVTYTTTMAGEDVMTSLHELVSTIPSQSGTSHDGKQLKRQVQKILDADGTTPQKEYEAMLEWTVAELDHQVPEPEDKLPF